ncbi:MAG TPA: hypothetical protein VKD22_07915 [Ramlibacter sp.]|nr:hypothetical protein [Ramlibacter sp.]
MADTFVELCVGSAAVSLFMVDRQSPLVGFAGGNAGYAEQIAGMFGERPPSKFVWVDAGPWGRTWLALRDDRAAVVRALQSAAAMSAREARSWAVAERDSAAGADAAAAHLLVIASTYGGFERGGFKGPHRRRPNVDGFIPSRLSLLARVRALRLPADLTIMHADAAMAPPCPAAVYIDPPYLGTTKYLSALPREAVVQVARAWAQNGARVVVSEGSPVAELVESGWTAQELGTRKGQGRTNARSAREFVTFNAG